VAPDRDVDAFDHRADGYDQGLLGSWHRTIAQRTAAIALTAVPAPRGVLDVGCGTGVLLELLAVRLPEARLAGVDPAARMVARSRERLVRYPHVAVTAGSAEHLPFEDGSFDLVVCTTAFDHWSDQPAGLRECARVLRTDGRLVLSDLFAAWLWRPRRARTKRRASQLVAQAGFRRLDWHRVYDLGPLPLVQTVVATLT